MPLRLSDDGDGDARERDLRPPVPRSEASTMPVTPVPGTGWVLMVSNSVVKTPARLAGAVRIDGAADKM